MIEKKLYSNHYLGAEITYRIVDTSIGKYKFRVTLYRECSGASFTNEKLIVRSAQSEVLLPLNFLQKEEITELCQVPDVSTNPITRCSDSLASSLFRGIERWVYETDYTVGKNIGWAYAAWTACCRSDLISTIADASATPIWVQTGFNTNYINNSIVGSAPPIPNWNRFQLNVYNMEAIDIFDPKMITINNKRVAYDSLAYELYTPMTGAPPNINTGYTSNPTITFSSGLSRTNFLYTVNGISLDSKTGNLSTIPTISQDAILALAVKEYRAVPNASGIGYSRVLVGYYMRDIQFSIKAGVFNTVWGGMLADSSKMLGTANSLIFKTCRLRNNKLQYQFVTNGTQRLKLKDLTSLDTSLIENYSYTTYNRSGPSQDTMYLNIQFDFKQNADRHKFLYQVYYCTASGARVDKVTPIEVQLTYDTLKFEHDTIYQCHDGSALVINLPRSESLKWTTNTPILRAESIDSSWIEVLPSHSGWFYASNAHTSSRCPANDSIYIQVDTCTQLSGIVYIDSLKNCVTDINELKISNEKMIIKRKNSVYTNSVFTNDTGFYSIKLPQNYSYDFSMENRLFNCASQANLYSIHISPSALIQHIPVKDSCQIKNIVGTKIDTNNCSGDSIRIKVAFYKTFGSCRSKIMFSSGDSLEHVFPIAAGNYSIDVSHRYTASGIHLSRIYWLNSNSDILDSLVYRNRISSCMKGYCILDVNSNCSKDSMEVLLENVLLSQKDVSSGKMTHIFTNNRGYYILPFDKSHSYELISNENILCGHSPNTINIGTFDRDTTIFRNINLNLDSLNYKLSINTRGRIDLFSSLYIDIYAKTLVEDTSILKEFNLILPLKSKFISLINHHSYNIVGRNLIVKSYKKFTLELKFDSLINGEVLCFNFQLGNVLNERNLYDNVTRLCLPAITSYDPNNKLAMIHSMAVDGSFTDKSHPFFYTINFQNTGSAPARNIYILDTLDKMLDISSLSILGSSHSMSATIDENRLLIFTFSNINLPDSISNEPASHGYVNFSIKPMANLELTQTISNKAGIYFDFNEAIFTNKVVNQYKLKDTSHETNSISLSRIARDIYVYPNPASDYVLVSGRSSAVTKIEMFNILGQKADTKVELVQNNIKIDTRALSQGIYLLQIKDRNDNLIKSERIVIQRDQ